MTPLQIQEAYAYITASYAWIHYASIVVVVLMAVNLIMLIFLISQARKNRESVIIKQREQYIDYLRNELSVKSNTITRQLKLIRKLQSRTKRDNV